MSAADGDYKYGIQLIAEELALNECGKDFYSLTQDLQYTTYLKAQEQYWDNVRQRDELRYGK